MAGRGRGGTALCLGWPSSPTPACPGTRARVHPPTCVHLPPTHPPTPSLRPQVDASGAVCGMAKDGARGIDPASLAVMVETAQREGPGLIAQIDAFLAVEAAKVWA